MTIGEPTAQEAEEMAVAAMAAEILASQSAIAAGRGPGPPSVTLPPTAPPLTAAFAPGTSLGNAPADFDDGLMVGDAIEVLDTHGIWAVARVVATLEHASIGPLLLVHFEGWGESWLMWLSRANDLDRVRPLGACPGIGSRGVHTAETFGAIVASARARIMGGRSTWARTGGGQRTAPFRHPWSAMSEGSNDEFVLTLSADEVRTWRASQRERGERAPPFFTAPFYACHALARDAAHCARVAGAVH